MIQVCIGARMNSRWSSMMLVDVDVEVDFRFATHLTSQARRGFLPPRVSTQPQLDMTWPTPLVSIPFTIPPCPWQTRCWQISTIYQMMSSLSSLKLVRHPDQG